jgi:phosphoserine aminotransferase
MPKQLFFTAGPSQIYPSLETHIKSAMEAQVMSMSHRGKEFEKLYGDIDFWLKKLLGIPEDYHVLFFSSATEIWERLIQNCVERSSFHFVNGAFGERFRWTSAMLGRNALSVVVPDGTSFDYGSVDVPDEAEMLCFTHNESSTGVMLRVADIHAMAKRYPDKLVAVDAVSSMPYPDFDYEILDAVYFSVQKGFGLPAGLGVLILSPRAFETSLLLKNKGISIGSYHSFPVMVDAAAKRQTVETPNVFALYLFARVLEDFNAFGIDAIRQHTDTKARLLYEFFESDPEFNPAVHGIRDRSATLVVVNVGGRAKQFVELAAHAGYEIGYGYADRKQDQIRIANFPAHSVADMEGLIGALTAM